tara:strand:- start:78 stop:473 length:396 start_codon:yes stop_codon:yes gene_type:complete
MNYNKAKKFYNKTVVADNSIKSPVELVKVMLTELNKSMNVVVNCIRNKEINETKSKHFSRALTIIYTLQTTLDFDKGGDLAVKLFQYYEFCRKQLIKGFSKNLYEVINKAIESVDEILGNKKEINGKFKKA